MSRRATPSDSERQRPRRARAGRAGLSAPFAGLVIFAHLLVAAHTLSHFDRASLEPKSQHCVICQLGKQSAGAAAAAIAASSFPATWIAGFANPPAPATQYLDGAQLARAPPSSAADITAIN